MIYVENAKEMIRIKRETYQKIHDLSDGKHGSLTLGFTAGRGIICLQRRTPFFTSGFQTSPSAPQRELSVLSKSAFSNGELDVAFLTMMDKDQTEDVYETFLKKSYSSSSPVITPWAASPSRRDANTPLLTSASSAMNRLS